MSRALIVLASANPGKLRELRALLGDLDLEVRAATVAELAALPEEGHDYTANAIAKAAAVAAASGLPALADDSGLEVRVLGGAPGPLSARYGGVGRDDAGRMEYLLAELARTGSPDRAARFVCVAALAWPDGHVEVRRGTCEGRVLESPRGVRGFGYDPVFEPEGEGRSMAELPEARKHELSHRGRALAALRPALARIGSSSAERASGGAVTPPSQR